MQAAGEGNSRGLLYPLGHYTGFSVSAFRRAVSSMFSR